MPILFASGIPRGLRFRQDGQLAPAWSLDAGEVYGLRKDLQALAVLFRFSSVSI